MKIETAPEYSLQTYGTVDPTGTADSTAAILGALAAAAADDSHWIQFGGVLPTSAAGLVAGSFWNNGGVVNVA